MSNALKIFNFDANASFGLLHEVRRSLVSESFLNPSSIHRGGQKARALLEKTRESLLQFLGLDPKNYRVIFCSGATEANNQVIQSFFRQADKTQAQLTILVGTTEHPSVLAPVAACKNKYHCEVISIHPREVEGQAGKKILSSQTSVLSTFMLANNETGRISSLECYYDELRKETEDTWIHTDAVQGPGKIDKCLKDINFDSAVISAHKFGGLSGIGALVIRRDKEDQLCSVLQGGPQEMGKRAGTENTSGVFSILKAIEVVEREFIAWQEKYSSSREELVKALNHVGVQFELNTNWQKDNLLSNTVSIRFPGIVADDVIVALDMVGVLCSAGSACSSGKPSPSHVLLAEGLSEQQARETIRVSFSGAHASEEIAEGISKFASVLGRISERKAHVF